MAPGQQSDRCRAIGMIFQIVRRCVWDSAVERGSGPPPALVAEDVIRCSTIAQTPGGANTFFRGQSGLVVLCIDESRRTAHACGRRNSRLRIRDPRRSTHVVPQALSAAAFILGVVPNRRGTLPEALTVRHARFNSILMEAYR